MHRFIKHEDEGFCTAAVQDYYLLVMTANSKNALYFILNFFSVLETLYITGRMITTLNRQNF